MSSELPRRCPCRKAFARVEGLCLTCALKGAVDGDRDDLAYQIARDFGQRETETVVRALIRARNERRQMAEVSAAIKAGRLPPSTPVARAAVTRMRESVRDMVSALEEGSRAA